MFPDRMYLQASTLEAALTPALSLFGGRRFRELPLEQLTLPELDSIVSQIEECQVREQAAFFRAWPLESLQIVTEEDYMLRRLWHFSDLMIFPIRRSGVLVAEYAIVEKDDCPIVHELKRMLLRVRDTPAYRTREDLRYREFSESLYKRYPGAVADENADRTVVYFFDTDGAMCGSYRRTTVGNF